MEFKIENFKKEDYEKVIETTIDVLQPENCRDFLVNYINNRSLIENEFEKMFYKNLEDFLPDMCADYLLLMNKDKDYKELCKEFLILGSPYFSNYTISEYISEISCYNSYDFYEIVMKYMKEALNETVEKIVRIKKNKQIIKIKHDIENSKANIEKYQKNIEMLKKRLTAYEKELKQLTEV